MPILSIVIPCVVNNLYPESAFRLVKVLESLGYEIYISENQGCCGYLYMVNGERVNTKEVAQKLLFDFQTGKRNHQIVTPSPKCYYNIVNSYRDIFHNSVSHNIYKKIVSEVVNLWDLLISKDVVINPSNKSLLVIDELSNINKIEKLTGFNSPDSNWVVKDYGYASSGANAGQPKFNPQNAEESAVKLCKFAIDKGIGELVFTDEFSLVHLNDIIAREGFPLKTSLIMDVLYKQMHG